MRRATVITFGALGALTVGCGDDAGASGDAAVADAGTVEDAGTECPTAEEVPDDPRVRAVAEWLGGQMEDRGIPGAVVAIVNGDEDFLVTLGNTGEGGCPVVPETRFNVGGLAHVLTAMAVLDAAEEGSVDLHAPVTDYGVDEAIVPTNEVGDASDVTLHHLLSQTAGLAEVAGLEGITECEEDLDAFLASTAPSPTTPPGAVARFNSAEILLAAHVLENATGEPIGQAIAERVFAPLGMEGAEMGTPDDSLGPVAHGHLVLGATTAELPPSEYACPALTAHNRAWVSGGDALAWLRMLANSETSILDPDHLADLADAGAPPYRYGTNGNGYGLLTFSYDEALDLGPAVGWHARAVGFHAGIRYYPDRRFGVFYTFNWMDGRASSPELWMALLDEATRRFVDEGVSCHCLADESCRVDARLNCRNPAEVARPRTDWSAYAGTYASVATDGTVEVTVDDDGVWVRNEAATDPSPTDLIGRDAFVVRGGGLDGTTMLFGFEEGADAPRWLRTAGNGALERQ